MKKRKRTVTAYFPALILAVMLLPATVPAAPAANDGTSGEIYIGSADELKAFRDRVNSGEDFSDQSVVLTAEIIP